MKLTKWYLVWKVFFFVAVQHIYFLGSTNVLAGPVYNVRNVRLLYVVCLYILETMLPTDLRPLVHSAERRKSKYLPPPILFQILLFVSKTSFFSKFEEENNQMRDSGVSRLQYALLLFKYSMNRWPSTKEDLFWKRYACLFSVICNSIAFVNGVLFPLLRKHIFCLF